MDADNSGEDCALVMFAHFSPHLTTSTAKLMDLLDVCDSSLSRG